MWIVGGKRASVVVLVRDRPGSVDLECMIMNEQERLDKVLATVRANVDDVCLVAVLTLPDSGAMNWSTAAHFYNQFWGLSGFVSQSEATKIIGGIGESHYDSACLAVPTLHAMPNVEVLLDPTKR
jgi:hypothetical protein